jgi:NAD(P)-dependent dehydrogenase (short-subunit alcohol dehydrogenase family)
MRVLWSKTIRMSNENKSLQNKEVVIMGATSGIGLAVALAAAKEGAIVKIASSNQQRINNTLALLPASASGYVVDLSSEQQIKTFFEQAGAFDHLVYTAGENIRIGKIAATDIDRAKEYLNIRYWGAVAAVKYGSQLIREKGSITLTSGIASQRPGSGWALGAGICGAMEGFCRAMAVELAPVRVNIVSPGIVRTNLWNSLEADERTALYSQASNSLLVKRVGEAEDLAKTYIYLMTQEYCTGQTLVVDGGGVLV